MVKYFIVVKFTIVFIVVAIIKEAYVKYTISVG